MAHILVVDDDADLRDAVKEALEDNLHEPVLTAASAEEALEAMRRDPVAVILADQRLPGMDGVSLLDAAERLQPGVGGILVTAWGWDTVREMGDRIAGRRVLQKPFTVHALLEEVRSVQAGRTEPLLA